MTKKIEFFSLPKAAEKCGVDRRTMWRWVKSKKIDSFVTPGGHHRILRSDLDKLLEGRRGIKRAQKTGKTVLVVDEDRLVREILKQRISEANYIVETASDGFKAGIKTRDVKPDLIIMDPMMAGINGVDVCRTINENRLLKGIKVILMTRYGVPENKGNKIKERADGYLPKDIDLSLLINKIDTLLKNDAQKPV